MEDMQQNLSQLQHQSQAQWLLMHQIEGISLLSMTQAEFQSAVRRAVEENPALEFAPQTSNGKSTGHYIDSTRTRSVTRQGQEKSEHYQSAYENAAQQGETLQEHLLFQLSVMSSQTKMPSKNKMQLSPDEAALGEKLIRNLDSNGYHTLDPATLLVSDNLIDKHNPAQNEAMLRRMISAIQHFDPEGTCCNNMEESLLVQAKIKAEEDPGAVPPLALFILDGHIDVLYSTSSTLDIKAILRKLKRLDDERRNMAFAAPSAMDNITLDEAAVSRAVSFISTLNPRPAQGFCREATIYVRPDVLVRRADGIYNVSMAHYDMPQVQLSKQFDQVPGREAAKKRVYAKSFIQNLEYRSFIVVKAAKAIVDKQRPFFDSDGVSPLVSFTQAELAKDLGVASSTVSRMVTSKYISSPWGRLYPMSHFFTNGQAMAKDAIQKIIQECDSTSPLSDMKIVRLLSERGIKIARRTVAKYRAAQGIKSSFKRHQDKKNNKEGQR